MNDLAHDISHHVAQARYRHCRHKGEERAIDDAWRRIARAVTAVEGPNAATWDSATNPCGEIPLPACGARDLGSINLTRFIEAPFTPLARLNA